MKKYNYNLSIKNIINVLIDFTMICMLFLYFLYEPSKSFKEKKIFIENFI